MGRPLQRPVSRNNLKKRTFTGVIRLGFHTATVPQLSEHAKHGLPSIFHSKILALLPSKPMRPQTIIDKEERYGFVTVLNWYAPSSRIFIDLPIA
jgi:hypothetical protein